MPMPDSFGLSLSTPAQILFGESHRFDAGTGVAPVVGDDPIRTHGTSLNCVVGSGGGLGTRSGVIYEIWRDGTRGVDDCWFEFWHAMDHAEDSPASGLLVTFRGHGSDYNSTGLITGQIFNLHHANDSPLAPLSRTLIAGEGTLIEDWTSGHVEKLTWVKLRVYYKRHIANGAANGKVTVKRWNGATWDTVSDRTHGNTTVLHAATLIALPSAAWEAGAVQTHFRDFRVAETEAEFDEPFRYGLMPGHPSPDTGGKCKQRLHCWFDRGAHALDVEGEYTAHWQYRKQGDTPWEDSGTTDVEADDADDLIGLQTIGALDPLTRYEYRVLLSPDGVIGNAVFESNIVSARTLSVPGGANGTIKVAWGSCSRQFASDLPFLSMRHALDEFAPDVTIINGDLFYKGGALFGPFTTHAQQADVFRLSHIWEPNARALHSTSPLIGTRDDRETGPTSIAGGDAEGGEATLLAASRAMAERYWLGMGYDANRIDNESEGYWIRLSKKCLLIVPDCRTQRSYVSENFLGDAQFDGIKALLENAPPVVIFASAANILRGYADPNDGEAPPAAEDGDGADGWAWRKQTSGTPAEQYPFLEGPKGIYALFDHYAANTTTGVLLPLEGQAHLQLVGRDKPWEDGRWNGRVLDVWESSPWASFGRVFADGYFNDDFDGDPNNATKLVFDGGEAPSLNAPIQRYSTITLNEAANTLTVALIDAKEDDVLYTDTYAVPEPEPGAGLSAVKKYLILKQRRRR